MVFSLVDHLHQLLQDSIDSNAQTKLGLELEKLALEELTELQRKQGTPVDVESFRRWKELFDLEIAATTAKSHQLPNTQLKNKKPTGRQLFENDLTLADSDCQFIDEGILCV